MTAVAASIDRPSFLRRILFVDAATCIAMGLFLVLLAQPLAPRLGLPAGLLVIAGASLFPIAAFMAWVATRGAFWRPGARLVVAGNAAWVVASGLLLAGGWVQPTMLGYLFVAVQACAVALLAAAEYAAYSRL